MSLRSVSEVACFFKVGQMLRIAIDLTPQGVRYATGVLVAIGINEYSIAELTVVCDEDQKPFIIIIPAVAPGIDTGENAQHQAATFLPPAREPFTEIIHQEEYTGMWEGGGSQEKRPVSKPYKDHSVSRDCGVPRHKQSVGLWEGGGVQGRAQEEPITGCWEGGGSKGRI